MAVHRDVPIIWSKRQQFEGTDHPGIRLNNLTTTQRDALTGSGAAKAGDAIFNTTKGAIEVYDGTAWPSAVGAVTTAATTTVQEYGTGADHLTVLTLTAFAVGTAGNSADLAIGASLYTFPSSAIMVENASVKGIFDKSGHGTITDGEIGLGSVIGSTAVDTIAEVGATSGDVMAGQAISSYVLGTTVATVAGTPVTTGVRAIATGGVKTVFLNLAATWPATANAVTFTGVVTIRWRVIS